MAMDRELEEDLDHVNQSRSRSQKRNNGAGLNKKHKALNGRGETKWELRPLKWVN